MATAEESLRTIDADGHVLEQLELDPAITAAFADRLSGGQVTSAEDPAPEEVSQAEFDVLPVGRIPTGNPAQGHGC